MPYDLITIVGPTACGKTAVAVQVAKRLNGEILSGDSRQVYRGMDIGTGKDLNDYTLPDGTRIPYHLIDIVDAGVKYNLFEYQRDFAKAYTDIVTRHKTPILCGGTGLYVEAIVRDYQMLAVPENPTLRENLKNKSLDELTAILSTYKSLHNTTDVDTTKRAIRAIEIADYQQQHNAQREASLIHSPIVFGIDISRELRRERISKRLRARLDEGMLQEVQSLLDKGIPPADLIYYGLEYKYVTLHLTGALTYQQMFTQLEIAIHQFAKRQMTWLRGMEKRGTHIHWLNGTLPAEEIAKQLVEQLN